MSKLTTAEYWDGTYAQASDAPLDLSSFRNWGQRQVVELIESVGMSRRRVLEVGAGNSAVLCYLARMHPEGDFHGMDYAPGGCAMLQARARREGVVVGAHQADMFAPSADQVGAYDVVFSLGLLEHFTDLAAATRAKAAFVRPGGTMVTVIPNMAGVLGRLTRRFNPQVYALHVPHNVRSLVQGHLAADLTVERCGYLGSTNFGVLSSCFKGPQDRGWVTYKWLARFTTATWWLESRTLPLPTSSALSPYLFVISRKYS